MLRLVTKFLFFDEVNYFVGLEKYRVLARRHWSSVLIHMYKFPKATVKEYSIETQRILMMELHSSFTGTSCLR